MASNGPSITKRNREQARRERVQEKADQRKEKAAGRQDREKAAPGEDPDLAGIVAGPQRPLTDD